MSRHSNLSQPGRSSLTPPGLVQLLASVVLLSSAWPLTKIALALGTTPLWFAEGRAVLSGVTATLLVAARGRLRVPGRADLPALVAIGALQLAGYFAFAHLAVAWVPAGRTAILANTTTIWIVPLSLVCLKEPTPPRRWAATAIGLTGVVVLVNPWAMDWTAPAVLIGHAFLLLASLCWSVAIIVTRAARPTLSMFELLPWCFALASLLLLPLVLLDARHGTLGERPACWLALLYIGCVAGPVGTWCVVEATAKLPTIVASIGFLMTPAVSLLLANLLLSEPITTDLLTGAALIIGGVAIAAFPADSLRGWPMAVATWKRRR